MPASGQRRSELISFLSRNEFLVRGRGHSGRELTHTLMNGYGGGRISLPDSAIDGFMSAYGSDMQNNIKLYVIERRTPIFKMHFDLDLKTMHDDSVTKSILNVLQQEVSKFVTSEMDRETWGIACAVLDDEQKTRGALGLHVVFPWLLVDTEQALWIRSSVVCCLRQQFPTLENDWDTVVDVAVLTSNGFRMVGSDKCRDCTSCHNARDARPFCAECCCQGRLPEGKIYWPWETFPIEATADLRSDLAKNKAHAVLMCSTRVPLSRQVASPRFKVPVGAPPPSIRKKVSSTVSRIEGRDYELHESAPCNLRLRTEPVEMNQDLQDALRETLLHHNIKYAFVEPIALDRLLGVRHRSSFCLKVRGFGCRYCQNKQEEHTQQTVYFILSRIGISQRCYSRKHVQRASGLCEKYASPATILLPSLVCLLYPDALDVPLCTETSKRSLEKKDTEHTKRTRSGLAIAEQLWGTGRK